MESSSCIFWRTAPFPLSSATKIKGQVVSCVAPGLPRKRFFLTTLERHAMNTFKIDYVLSAKRCEIGTVSESH